MLDTLITSKTRIKLLLRFFLNNRSSSYLRNLETEFGESTNSIRLELNRFEKAGLLISGKEQNRKIYKANHQHPLFPDIQSIIKKYVGFDQMILNVVEKLGSVQRAYISGGLAKGIDCDIIELFLIGKDIDVEYLERLVDKTNQLIHRQIQYTLLNETLEKEFTSQHPSAFLVWSADVAG